MIQFELSNIFSKELPADPLDSNIPRQVTEACFSFVEPTKPKEPSLVHLSSETAEMLGLSEEDIKSAEFLKYVTGEEIIPGTKPYAMCYGGHQFGNWAGQLGDGRAINLTEILSGGKQFVLQLKGAGKTPYSRGADGLAVLRSSIREHLCSEAMFHLGVPTTRSLSLSLSGDAVLRDVLYNGFSAYEKGAVVCRVAESFIRFGSFQIFSGRGDDKSLKKLTDFTIKHYYPEISVAGTDKYVAFFNEVVDRSLEMVIHWQRVGFVHGVMNTDNMSILGLTIDYGPYGWLEGYDPSWTPNTTDAQNSRYRYGAQPSIVLWNLYQLANTLNVLVDDSKPFEAALERYKRNYSIGYMEMMRSKVGLATKSDGDFKLVQDLEKILELTETDMTLFFRLLSELTVTDSLDEVVVKLNKAFYKPEDLVGVVLDQWNEWLGRYLERINLEPTTDEERAEAMNGTNPKYVLRNYMAQLAIEAADNGDYSVIEELYQLLKKPYDAQPDQEKWFAKRPEWARNKVGCSALSCSS
jgi:uncharacterized protein YdiU (UPF0061 family)